MRILQISTHGIRCGIATYTDTLAQAINRDGRAACDIHPLDLDHIHRLRNPRAVDAYYASLLPAAKKHDIVHIQHEYNFFGGGALGVAAANTALGTFVRLLGTNGVKAAVTFHTDPRMVAYTFRFTARPHKLLYRLDRLRAFNTGKQSIARAFPGAGAIAIVHNAFATESVHTELGVSRDRIHKVNLLVQDRPAPPAEDRRRAIRERVSRELSLQENDVVIGIVGFISEYKGHLEALQALHLLPPNHKLLIIGGKHPLDISPFFDRVLKLARRLGLERRVYVTDVFRDEDIPCYLDLTRLLVAPYAASFRSSSGALTLAICSGRPVVASAINPFIELNKQSHCLELHSPHCVHELAYRIRSVLTCRETSDRLVAAAAAYARENSPDRIAARHIDLFQNMPPLPAN